jgi:hypothetical protein
MPVFDRYKKDGFRYDFKGIQSTESINTIRSGIESGDIQIIRVLTLTETDRVEHIAGALYGDSRYWWIIAAASEIGWALQAPPGTIIKVPDLNDVQRLLG